MPRKKKSPAPPGATDSSPKPDTPALPGASGNLAARRKQDAPSASPEPQPLAMAARVKSPAAKSDAKREKEKSPPRTHRELAEAIFAQCDPVALGRELLQSGGSERGDSVKARVWERLVEFLLGKPAPAPKQERPLQIIWDIPGPQRDPSDY